MSIQIDITSTPFSTNNSNNQHQSTDWVIEDSSNNVIYNNLGDTTNLTSLTLVDPPNITSGNTYTLKVKYNGSILDSNEVSVNFSIP